MAPLMITWKMSVVVKELFHGSELADSVITMLPVGELALIVSVIVVVFTFHEMLELDAKKPSLAACGAMDMADKEGVAVLKVALDCWGP